MVLKFGNYKIKIHLVHALIFFTQSKESNDLIEKQKRNSTCNQPEVEMQLVADSFHKKCGSLSSKYIWLIRSPNVLPLPGGNKYNEMLLHILIRKRKKCPRSFVSTALGTALQFLDDELHSALHLYPKFSRKFSYQ